MKINIIIVSILTLLLMGCGGAHQQVLTKQESQKNLAMLKSLYTKKYEVIHNPKAEKILPNENAFKEAILKLDTQGHTSQVNVMLLTSDGKELITGSEDKTIRVWDVKTGKTVRKILGYISDNISGMDGMINSMALSVDDKYLAVSAERNSIRIYDYRSGDMSMILPIPDKNIQNFATSLSFSDDGEYLVTGTFFGDIYVWRTSDFKLEKSIKYHTSSALGIAMVNRSGGHMIAVINRTQLCTHSYEKDKLIKCYDAKETKNTKQLFNQMAINEKNIVINSASFLKKTASSIVDKKLLVFDYDLNLKQDILTDAIGFLQYSTGGQYLMVSPDFQSKNLSIYDASMSYKKIQSFPKSSARPIVMLDNIIYGSSEKDNSILRWNIQNGKRLSPFLGDHINIKHVTLNGNQLYFGAGERLTKEFDIDKTIISPTDMSIKELLHSDGVDTIKIETFENSGKYIVIRKNGQITGKIPRDLKMHYMGLSKDYLFINYENGGGLIYIYNHKGEEIGHLIGHQGIVNSISIQGDKVLSGGTEGTLLLWDVAELANYKPILDDNRIEKSYQIQQAKKYAKKQSLEEWKEFIDKKSKYRYAYLTKLKINPTVSVFVDNKDEWVMWTDSGYFDASKNGAQYIGFHVNQGRYKEAEWVSVDKFYDTFYRPDIVQKVVSGSNMEIFAKDMNIDMLMKTGLAPKVSILTASHDSQNRDLALKLRVCTMDGGFNNLTILLDGMPVEVMVDDRALKMKNISSKTETDSCFTFDKLISLQKGKNVIGFKATNKDGMIDSNIAEIEVAYMSTKKAKPNLHILTIAIDKYRDGDLWLKYSKQDAKGIKTAIKQSATPLFNHIYTYSIQDKTASKKNILNKFKEVGKQTTRDDVFILYVAGHGITDTKTGAYFYLPVDFRYKSDDSVRKTGFSQDDFKMGLSHIQAMKSLIMLDTCNSGSFAEALASRGVLQKTAINKLTRATGRATIVASSKDQVALEGYKGHGVFTYTLIEAFQDKGYGTDNNLTIKELAAYVENVLPDRTYEKWGYEQIPQSHITGNDFPIGVR